MNNSLFDIITFKKRNEDAAHSYNTEDIFNVCGLLRIEEKM